MYAKVNGCQNMKTMTFVIQSVVRVHDGDTLTVMVDRGWSDYSQRDVRVQGIDAPEITGPTKREGTKVRDAAIAWIAKNKPTMLVSYALDEKYGRVLGDLIAVHDQRLSNYLLLNKLALPYDGGTKAVWTPELLAAVDAFVIQPAPIK